MVAETEGPQINDLIFKELIKRGYSLEGNTRIWNIADSKLWYLTPKQAQGYLDLEESEDYQKDTGQEQHQDLMKNNLKEILKEIGEDSVNIVDLGCGDGKKAARFVEQMKEVNPALKVRYCPIDISGHMVEKAIETFTSLGLGDISEFQYNISDFENLDNVIPLLQRGEYKKNIILLLGNTLGNFEIHELLYGIRSNMKGRDLFIVDTAIDDHKQEERIKSYANNIKVKQWLVDIPLQVGLKEDEIELGFRWKNHRIEGFYTIRKSKKVKFQNKEIRFLEGDQIVVIVAYKYDLEDLKTFLNIHFDNVIVECSNDKSKVLALCKK